MKNEVLTICGTHRWHPSTILSQIRNEAYKGDKLLQKSYTPDFLSHTPRKNNGEVRQYYVTGGHEAIIEPALFDHVQKILLIRVSTGRMYNGMNPLSGKMFCGICGKHYGVRYWHLIPCWQCREKALKGCTCFNIHIYDYALSVQLREILIRFLQRTDVLSTCSKLVQAIITEDSRRAEALDFIKAINISKAESLVETEDYLMFIDRITAFPDNHIEVRLINGRVICHALRNYSPKIGWHWPYNSRAHRALTSRRKV